MGASKNHRDQHVYNLKTNIFLIIK